MPPKKRTSARAPDETTELRNRLEETEDTLNAIRQYLVDAFVVSHANGTEVVTLSNAEIPYRLMVESMNEGAVTLIPDGTIFYANQRFAEILKQAPDKLIGVRFQDLIIPAEREAFEVMLANAGPGGLRGEFCVRSGKRKCVPVQLSVYQLAAHGARSVAIIATDITERIQAEKNIRSLASKLTIAEQEERHRISQILHDDLQQHLFAIKAQLAMLTDADEGSQVSPSMQTNLDQIQKWLSEAINITRNLSIDLSPAVLQGEGLTEAISWLAAQMNEQYGLDVRLQANDSLGQLDNQLRVLLFHAVRELLFNIVKHSGTLQAVVTLEQAGGRGRITIADDGSGFNVQRVMENTRTAHGLLILQDRLGLVGCQIDLHSRPGGGTRATIEIPLGRMPG